MKVFISIFLTAASLVIANYEPKWDSLDARPLPEWYDEVKFGIFCHWGVYSVPAYKSEWFWWYWQGDTPDNDTVEYVKKNYPPGTTYADFGKDFKAEFFDPNEFVNVVQSSGAKYFILTSKHHEGFTMWKSPQSWNWNAVDIGPKRDLVDALATAFKKSPVHFGLYFSQFEWFHPLFLLDNKQNTSLYSETVSYPQMFDIVNKYEPEIIWSDGDWGKSAEYWKSKDFLTWLYDESPVKDKIVVNDRWGSDTIGKHGGFMTYALADVVSSHEVIEQLARTISCGGNLLVNVGPDMHGRIPIIFQDRLKQIGDFLSKVSEAVYTTKPWIHQNDTGNIWYTARYRSLPHKNRLYLHQYEDETIIYAWIIDVNTANDVKLDLVKTTEKTKVTFLGTDVTIESKTAMDHLTIPANVIPWLKLPRLDVMVLKIENASTQKPLHRHYKKIKKPSHVYQVD